MTITLHSPTFGGSGGAGLSYFSLDSQLSQPSLETDLAATFAVIRNGDILAVAEYSKEGEEAVIFLQQKRAARKETIRVSSCSRGVQRGQRWTRK